MIDFKITLIDMCLHYSVKHKETTSYLKQFQGDYKEVITKPISASNEDFQRYGLNPNFALDEIQILAYLTSKALIPYNSFLFHGAAFKWKDEIWILTAPSGTGKTTQFQNWVTEFPEEIEMINGDKPILKWDDGKYMVYPSPWMGKERYGSNQNGKLAGMIILEQDKTNSFQRLKPNQAVIPILIQFITFMETKEEIEKIIELEKKLLKCVPVFLFKNTGDITSTKLLRQHLKEYTSINENGESDEV